MLGREMRYVNSKGGKKNHGRKWQEVVGTMTSIGPF